MCESNATNVPNPIPNMRRRIWEVNTAMHCSIIGTCLTLGELRALARKLGYQINQEKDTDANLHSNFVREVGKKTLAAKLLNKLLERKYASTIRRFKQFTTSADLEKAWDEACQMGDIPGPYWAVLSHPNLDHDLGVRIHGDVHMLSHLVGASNRADIAALRLMEQSIAHLEERQVKENWRHHQRIAEKEHSIIELRNEVVSLKSQLVQMRQNSCRMVIDGPAVDSKSVSTLSENEDLKHGLAAAIDEIEKQQTLNQQMASTIAVLETEAHSLEQALTQQSCKPLDKSCPLDLDGSCILYVGGRASEVCRMRALVASWNGDLLHHDGGMEKSMDVLARAVSKADAVVFPTDCVSHNAALKVKSLCRQTMKPYVPLRTTGVASLIAGLRESLTNIQAHS